MHCVLQMPEKMLPECVPVLLAEQLIFCLAGGGLLMMVGGPHWTLAPMPASALLAATLAFLTSIGAFFFRVAFPDSSQQTAAAMQQLAMVWTFAHTVQHVVFSIVLRLQSADDTDLADNPFILMFNAERVDPYGLGATTLHMVVNLVFCAVLLALFTSTHYFLRDPEARGVEWPLLAMLFFVQSQFLLFHSEDQALALRQNTRCTRVFCDVLHTVIAAGVLAGLMAEHFAMELVLEHFKTQMHRNWTPAIVYVLVHVLGVPVSGFVAVHVVSWLQEPGLYAANVAFLSILLLTRIWHAWQHLHQGVSSGPVDPITTNDQASFAQQTFVTGTQQPRYFFKRLGEGKTKRRKKE